MPPTLLTASELGDALGVSYPDVLRWTKEGMIPSVRAGRQHFYVVAQVTKALRERQRKTAHAVGCAQLEAQLV